MLRDAYDSGMSQLERELELEMDDLESADGEADEEFEESDEFEYETGEEELEAGDEEGSNYTERFYELSQREFESESELDREFNALHNEMEEYFLGGVGKFLKSKAKGLLSKGLAYAKKRLPGFNLKLLLKRYGAPLLKRALAATPQGAAALTALNAIGYEAGDPEMDREVWDNYVAVCREAYQHLAQNLNEDADQPLEAARIATNAFQAGVKRVQARTRVGQRPGFVPRRGGATGTRKRRRVIYLGPNESVVIRRR